jgi:hypothetical protein
MTKVKDNRMKSIDKERTNQSKFMIIPFNE